MPQNVIELQAGESIEAAVQKLQLPARPLLLLLGDFDPGLNANVQAICRRVLAPAAVNPGALVLDDASCTGFAAAMGAAARFQDQTPLLLGVVPNNRPANAIEPNHEIVFRLPAEWDDWAKYALQIADCLVKNGSGSANPALAILAGGGDAEKEAVLRCGERDWPVLAIGGTGRLADQILDAETAQAPAPADPDIREIVDTVEVHEVAIDADMDDFSRVVLGQIQSDPSILTNSLREAWGWFDKLDQAAVIRQIRFRSLELTLILLAVIATLFAILSSGNALTPSFKAWVLQWWAGAGTTLHILVIIIPILISIAGTYNSHFRDGNKWILLRGAAEAIKREIFRFRAQAGVYSERQCGQISAESKLAAKIKDITSALEQSEVNKTSLGNAERNKLIKAISLVRRMALLRKRQTASLRNEETDAERMELLTTDRYIVVRIENQMDYLERKTGSLSIRLSRMQMLIYIIGGTGTFLAAIRLYVWVALATALVTAVTTKLQADQVENSLVQYNQTLASLRNIDAWWKALSVWERERRRNIDLLVDETERTMANETAGWVQQMQSALDKLTEREPSSVAK